MLIAQYIDQIIQFGAGVLFTVIGFSRSAAPANGGKPRYPAWMIRFFQIGGPLLIFVAILLAAGKYFGAE